jgi:hypothetical protein
MPSVVQTQVQSKLQETISFVRNMKREQLHTNNSQAFLTGKKLNPTTEKLHRKQKKWLE